MKRFRELGFLFVIVFVFSFAFPAASKAQQSDNGSFTGFVSDPDHKSVPGATVTVTSLGTGLKRTTTTNEDGRWTINALPLGAYTIKAEAPNFKEGLQRATITASSTTTVDVTLGIAEQSATVTVVAGQDSSNLNPEQTATTISTTSG